MNVEHAIHAGYAHGMYQHLEEIRGFGTLITRKAASKVVEIGAHRGGTTAFFASLCPDLVVSIDMPDGPWGGIGVAGADERDRTLAKIAPHYRPIRGNSQDLATIQALDALLQGDLVDILFIDGDHSRAGVSADYENYKRFVKAGGLIGFHDILHCDRHTRDGVEVPQFWDELKMQPGAVTQEFVANQGWGGIGVIWNGWEAVVR